MVIYNVGREDVRDRKREFTEEAQGKEEFWGGFIYLFFRKMKWNRHNPHSNKLWGSDVGVLGWDINVSNLVLLYSYLKKKVFILKFYICLFFFSISIIFFLGIQSSFILVRTCPCVNNWNVILRETPWSSVWPAESHYSQVTPTLSFSFLFLSLIRALKKNFFWQMGKILFYHHVQLIVFFLPMITIII